jgi:hypothetical protein
MSQEKKQYITYDKLHEWIHQQLGDLNRIVVSDSENVIIIIIYFVLS